ncbi:MAG: NAD(P)H-binding protein [Fibrobacterales bacterium]
MEHTQQKRITIIGSGWLGLPLIAQCVEKGHTVKATTTSPHRIATISAVGAEAFLFDIALPEQHDASLFQSDVLIINIPAKNITAFKSLITLIEASSIQSVLLVSSTSVYQATNSTVTENAPTASNTPLIMIEKMFAESQHFQTTILRFAGLIGPQRHPGRFFSTGKSINNPSAPVNLIHRDDCLGIINAIVTHDAWGEVFNGCAESHPSKIEFYSKAAQQLNHPEPLTTPNSNAPYKRVDGSKISHTLGYHYKYPNCMESLDSITPY